MTKEKNGEYVLHLKVTEVALIHCNTVNNQDQHDARLLRTFVPTELFNQLLNISQTNHI